MKQQFKEDCIFSVLDSKPIDLDTNHVMKNARNEDSDSSFENIDSVQQSPKNNMWNDDESLAALQNRGRSLKKYGNESLFNDTGKQ